MDSAETILQWDDQFFEIDQLYDSVSDDEKHVHDQFNHSLRVKYFPKRILFNIIIPTFFC